MDYLAYLLNQLFNSINIRRMADYYDSFKLANPNFVYPDSDYLMDEFLRQEEEEKKRCKEELNQIELIEIKNTYIKALKKRYEDRSKDSSKNLKQIYMYEVYEYLKDILHLLRSYDDECEDLLIKLIKKLKNEGNEKNIFNIDSNKINYLIFELKYLQEIIESINFELIYKDLDIVDFADRKIIEIISINFWDKQRQYKDNRSNKFKKRKERRNEYIKLYRLGYKKCEIAKMMGVTKSAVSKFFKQNTIK